MRPISKPTTEKLENSERMKKCCLLDYECSGRIEWHHNLIYGGRQSDIPETILGICKYHHDQADKTEIKEKLNWIMLNQMSDQQIKSISKAINYAYQKEQLNRKFGER